MGKQATIRAIRKRIKKDGGITKKLVQEIAVNGYSLILRSDKPIIKITHD